MLGLLSILLTGVDDDDPLEGGQRDPCFDGTEAFKEISQRRGD